MCTASTPLSSSGLSCAGVGAFHAQRRRVQDTIRPGGSSGCVQRVPIRSSQRVPPAVGFSWLRWVPVMHHNAARCLHWSVPQSSRRTSKTPPRGEAPNPRTERLSPVLPKGRLGMRDMSAAADDAATARGLLDTPCRPRVLAAGDWAVDKVHRCCNMRRLHDSGSGACAAARGVLINRDSCLTTTRSFCARAAATTSAVPDLGTWEAP